MRIDAGMASFYNASSSRLQSVNNAGASAKVSGAQGSSQSAGNGNSASQYVSKDHGGVVQTRVSAANSYQKAMLDNPRSIAEGMASKLMGKLPNILRDMQNIPDESSMSAISSSASGSGASGKVVITDAGAMAGSNGSGAGSSGSGASASTGAAGAMMNFSL